MSLAETRGRCPTSRERISPGTPQSSTCKASFLRYLINSPDSGAEFSNAARFFTSPRPSTKDGCETNSSAFGLTGGSAAFSVKHSSTHEHARKESISGDDTEARHRLEAEAIILPDRPLRVSDLDQSAQISSWIKKPLYYTHHRRENYEQLSQAIRLPPTQRHVNFTASEGASWDCIADNAFQASQKLLRRHGTMVVLLYCVSCNPFHLGDIDVLKRARASLETLKRVCVVGALVVPLSDAALRDAGTQEDRRLPFTLRRDLARNVLKGAQQDDWVIVDTCLGVAEDQTRSEGCMNNVVGSIAPFVSVYARGRLHSREHDIRVVEVHAQDSIEGSTAGRPFDQLHVHSDKAATNPVYGPHGVKPGLAAVGTLVVDVPKSAQCDDLVWSAVKNPRDRTLLNALERFCGPMGARMIAHWASRKPSVKRGKSKLLSS